MATLSTTVDIDQYELVARCAKEMQMSISEYLRYTALQCANHHYTQTRIEESNAELLRKLRIDLTRTANFIAERMAEKKQ